MFWLLAQKHLIIILESYNVDKDSVSVSGLSAGGFMAVQMHVAYSSLFVGVGVFAGGKIRTVIVVVKGYYFAFVFKNSKKIINFIAQIAL